MAKVKANLKPDFDHCSEPGDYFITDKNVHEEGMRRLSFICPCGCGHLAGIRVRDDGKQDGKAWGWNQSVECPTVTPSIDINHGHWHGYLTNGVFEN